MKKLQRAFLFLPFLCLIVLASCSKQDDLLTDLNSEPVIAAAPDIDVTCCAECGSHCLLGYDFQANTSDPNFPQGGYKVALVDGDCECAWGDNGAQVIINGSAVWSYGFTGGPAGGAACNAPTGYLASEIFGSYCSGNWIASTGTSDPIGIGGTFGQFSEDVRLQALTYQDPNDAPIIGLMNWPASWNISVVESINNRITVNVASGAPASQLRRIGIFPDGTGTASVFTMADGSTSYTLDMSAQPSGSYTVKLDFWPGFHLIKSIENIVPRGGK